MAEAGNFRKLMVSSILLELTPRLGVARKSVSAKESPLASE